MGRMEKMITKSRVNVYISDLQAAIYPIRLHHPDLPMGRPRAVRGHEAVVIARVRQEARILFLQGDRVGTGDGPGLDGR